MTTPEQEKEWGRLAAEATPGPWTCDDDDEIDGTVIAEGTAQGVHIAHVSTIEDFPCLDEDNVDQTEQAERECRANKALIAASITAVPLLLAELKRTREECERMRPVVEAACSLCDFGNGRSETMFTVWELSAAVDAYRAALAKEGATE